jgi:hypothetical protein
MALNFGPCLVVVQRTGVMEDVVFVYAHGVGPVPLSGGFSEPLLDDGISPLHFANGTITVPKEKSLLDGFAFFPPGLEDDRPVFRHAIIHGGNILRWIFDPTNKF